MSLLNILDQAALNPYSALKECEKLAHHSMQEPVFIRLMTEILDYVVEDIQIHGYEGGVMSYTDDEDFDLNFFLELRAHITNTANKSFQNHQS